MPHKIAIIKHLDELTPEARDVGAVNTVIIRNENGMRKYIGTNTDVNGIRDAFYQNVANPKEVFHNRPGLIVGGGGAARSAVYALQRWMQCQSIYIVNRDKSEVDAIIEECQSKGFGYDLVHVATLEQAQSLEGPGAIVACVPDFAPKTPDEFTVRQMLECMVAKSHKGAVLEMCYNPSPWTQIAEISKNAGWQVILGTEAMIYQGLEQVCSDIINNPYMKLTGKAKLWTGRDLSEIPVKEVHDAIAAKLAESNL
jgi:quinate dehydrogenase